MRVPGRTVPLGARCGHDPAMCKIYVIMYHIPKNEEIHLYAISGHF
jgi:hypothetical protein